MKPGTLAKIRHDLGSSPGRPVLYAGVLLVLALSGLMVLSLPASWLPKDESPAIHLTKLGHLVVGENFVPYLLHSGLSFALLLILIGIYRLTKKDFVAYWAGALGSFFCLYTYMLLRVYFVAGHHQPSELLALPRWDLYWTEAFSFGSTIMILLAGLSLLRIELPRRHQTYLAATAFLGLAVLHAVAKHYARTSLALFPGGMLSLGAVWTAGYGLYGRMKKLEGRTWAGTIFLLTFVAYGLIQPLILVINAPGLDNFVPTGTYLLKALCTGFIIFLVLNETWKEKETQLNEIKKIKEDRDRILDENNLGYFRTTKEGLILEANEAEARLLGYDSPDDLKNKINRLSLIQDQDELEIWESELTRAGVFWNRLNRIRTSKQEIRHFRTNCQALPTGADGELRGFKGIDRDVTAEVVLDQEKLRQSELLEGFNEAFSSSMSVSRFFTSSLEIVAHQASAKSAAFLLIGRETEMPARLLIVQGVSPQRQEAAGRVYQISAGSNENMIGTEPSSLGEKIAEDLFGAEAEDERTLQIPMLRLDRQQQGLVILRVSRADLGEVEGRLEALRQFLSRVALHYPHVLRQELQGLRQKIRSFLSQPEEVDSQMRNVVSLLREEFRSADVRLALRLWRDGEVMYFPRERGTAEPPATAIPLEGKLPANFRQIWHLSLESLVAEVIIPILDRYSTPFGYLLIRSSRSDGGSVSAFSVVDFEKLQDISESIGVIAEMWASVYNMTKLLETTTHEFRSPAVAIRNTVDVLRKNWSSYPKERIERKLTDIALDSSLLLGLTNNLDALNRRPIVKLPKPVSLFQDIVFKTIRQLRPLAQKLTYEHEGSHRFPMIHAVEQDLQQIVFNLVHNAIKYSKDGAVQMKFIGGQEVDFLTLKIQDWGIGVPPGYEEKIFAREVRAPNALKSNVNGLGMGLAVSLELARQMEGDLKLTRSGEPTELTLFIPKKYQISSEVPG